MIILLALTAHIQAQSANCNILPADTPCGPQFAGFPVNKPVEQFVANLRSNVININQVAKDLQQGNACNSRVEPMVSTLRYQASIQCAIAVQNALTSGCKPADSKLPATGPLLCTPQCQLAASSFSSIVTNSTVCPNNAFSTFFKTLTDSCQYTKANAGPNSPCFEAVPSELTACGIFH